MAIRFIQVGEKGKHVPIPSGYVLVLSGELFQGDKALNIHSLGWELLEPEDHEMMQVEDYDYVIREEHLVQENSPALVPVGSSNQQLVQTPQPSHKTPSRGSQGLRKAR